MEVDGDLFVVVKCLAVLTGLADQVVNVSDDLDAVVGHPLKEVLGSAIHVGLGYGTVSHDGEGRAVLDRSEGVVAGSDVVPDLMRNDAIVARVRTPHVCPPHATDASHSGPGPPGAVRDDGAKVVEHHAFQLSAGDLLQDFGAEGATFLHFSACACEDVGVAAIFHGEVLAVCGNVEGDDLAVDVEFVVQLVVTVGLVKGGGVGEGLGGWGEGWGGGGGGGVSGEVSYIACLSRLLTSSS